MKTLETIGFVLWSLILVSPLITVVFWYFTKTPTHGPEGWYDPDTDQFLIRTDADEFETESGELLTRKSHYEYLGDL